MKFCSHCGKELLDEAVMCPGCGCMITAVPMYAAPVQPAPAVQPALFAQAETEQAIPVQSVQTPPGLQATQQPKKFCSHCGKELLLAAVMCPGCGCMVEQPTRQMQNNSTPKKTTPKATLKPVTYEEIIQNANITNIISAALLVVSAIVWWCFSVYGGAIIALAAELVVLIPNTKLQNQFKRNGLGKENKNEIKEITNDLKAKKTAFRFSFIIAVLSLCCLILYLLLPEFM